MTGSCKWPIAWEYLDYFYRYFLLFYSVLLQSRLSVVIVSYCSINVPSHIWFFIYYLLLIVILTPHPSPLIPHPSPLTPHPSPLTPHPSPLTPHPSPLTPHPSPLTPHPRNRHAVYYYVYEAENRQDFWDFVPRDPAFASVFSRRSAILKIVEEKALGTRLDLLSKNWEWGGEMPYNRYKLKCYSSCLVAPYMVLAGMVDSDVTFLLQKIVAWLAWLRRFATVLISSAIF